MSPVYGLDAFFYSYTDATLRFANADTDSVPNAEGDLTFSISHRAKKANVGE